MDETFESWIGRSAVREDVATPRLLAEYRATLGPHLFGGQRSDEGPPGFHWGLAPATPGMGEIGPDGAEAKGNFLPPIPLPRRMWAGGSIETLAPITLGTTVRRVSKIADVKHRAGKSGRLYFVAISHDIETDRGLAVRERQDLVFRDGAATAVTEAEAPLDGLRWTVDASPALLFRFSAFTFNGHRIHYDAPYAEAEGYPGLVVHGPLQAALMLNQASAILGRVPRRFDYRCVAPLIGGNRFTVSSTRDGGAARTRITRHDGVTTAEGQVPAPGT